MNAPDLADNVILLGHTDQGGRGDGVQVMVGDGERPAWPSERRYGLHHAIVADGLADASWLVFATYQNAGVRVFDLANPLRPPPGRRLRAARSRTDIRHQAQPASGHPVLRRLYRPRRRHVRHRLQRRALRPAV